MGWGNCGVDSNGRPIGYNHEATCDHPSCSVQIDRGLGYACGGMHGEDEYSCEKYFCEHHRRNYLETDQGNLLEICDNCRKIALETKEWFEDEEDGVLRRIESYVPNQKNRRPSQRFLRRLKQKHLGSPLKNHGNFNKYPHWVFVSVLLIDLKIINWKIGNWRWTKDNFWRSQQPIFILNKNPNRIKVRSKAFYAGNLYQHNHAFETRATIFLRRYPIHEDFPPCAFKPYK